MMRAAAMLSVADCIRDDAAIRWPGIPTWIALRRQFYLLRRRIGDNWRGWLPEERQRVRDQIRLIVEVYNQLSDERNDVA
jgi:hypothetical protein